MAKSEPDHSAASAARALGYLAWNLDTSSDGGSNSDRRTEFFEDTNRTGIATTPALPSGGQPAETVSRYRPHAMAITTMVPKAKTLEGNEDAVGDREDWNLQDAAVLTLAARTNAVEEAAAGLANAGVGERGGEIVVGQGRAARSGESVKDRKADTTAAKCRRGVTSVFMWFCFSVCGMNILYASVLQV